MSEDVENFLKELSELSQEYGVFIIGKSDSPGYRRFSLVRLNEPHERPSEYPDVTEIDGEVSFSTLGEFYGGLRFSGVDETDE